jgi:hypothetical protein
VFHDPYPSDLHPVNIPAPRHEVDGVRTPRGRRAPCQTRVSRKGEGVYDPEAFGSAAKKSRRRTSGVPVLKLFDSVILRCLCLDPGSLFVPVTHGKHHIIAKSNFMARVKEIANSVRVPSLVAA